MEPIEVIVAILVSTIASSGFWTYMSRRDTKKSSTTRLLLGLAHDRIIFLGMNYITRGWITKDEFEDFVKYLWEPYSEFGGNGLAEKVYATVKALPIVLNPPPTNLHTYDVPVTVVTNEREITDGY